MMLKSWSPAPWRRLPRFVLLCLALCAVRGAPGVAADDPNAPVRQAFLDAMASAAVAPVVGAAADSPALQQYVLYPYLQAARLRTELQLLAPAAQEVTSSTLPVDGRIDAFLQQRGAEPVATRLRQDWLASLAARKAWATYLAQFNPQRDLQATFKCNALTARIALGKTDGLADALTELWLAPRALPDTCDPALDWWKTRGGPGPVLSERRARIALESGEPGLARVLLRAVPDDRAAPLLQWAALIEQPAREVAALIADPARPVLDEALADGWTRFARADPDAAAATLDALIAARKLDARTASPYALTVALTLAWARKPGALALFDRVHPDDFDERAYEWRARAALWAADWTRAAAAIAAMPDALRQQPRWRYWSARAREQLGDFAGARGLYLALIPADNWYAMLAAARLAQKLSPTLQPMQLNGAAVDALATEPGFVRAHELVLCGMEPEAGAEWRAAFDELPPMRQADAVGLAAHWGWHHQAIAAAARLKVFNDYELLYPRPFDFEVRDASRRTGLSEPFIYAIIRQESLYRADAGSSAGALGLMQLLPSTARITARREKLPLPTRDQLLQPAVNIPLGAAYLARLVDRFDGDNAVAMAAYNAGPTPTQRWLPDAPLDLDVWTENIPYNETRAYVQRVAWHTLVFAWLVKREPQDVKPWLRSVRPAKVVASDGT